MPVTMDEILKMEKLYARTYRKILTWIEARRQAGFLKESTICARLEKVARGQLSREEIRQLIAGKMPRIPVVERLEAAQSRGGKPHKKATATV